MGNYYPSNSSPVCLSHYDERQYFSGGFIIPDSENNFSFIFKLLMYFQIFNQLNFSAGRFQFAFEVLNKPLLLFFSISLLTLSRILAEKNLSLAPFSFKSHVLTIFCGSFSIFIAYLIKIILPSRVFFSVQGIQLGKFSYYWSHKKKHQLQRQIYFFIIGNIYLYKTADTL